MLDDACVMAGCKRVGAGAACEREQPAEAEPAVARNARVRRLAARVAPHERVDNCSAELLAQIERDVRDAEGVARFPGRDHGLGRAAGALGIRPVGVEPEPQGHADRIGQRLQQCDGTVDAAAHRDRDPAGGGRCSKGRPDRIREGIDGKRLPADRSSLHQRQPNERSLEPGGLCLRDAVAVDGEPDKGKFTSAGRIPN